MQFYFFTAKIIRFISVIVLGSLVLRLVLKLFGASADVAIVGFIYNATYYLIGFLDGIFPAPQIWEASVFELATLFAIIIFGLIFYFLQELVETLTYKKAAKELKE